MNHRTARRFRRSIGATAAIVALAAPASAVAGSGYVVTLSSGASCTETTAAVTSAYAITPTATYSSSTCGFSANLTKKQAEALQADPRVLAVRADGAVVMA